VQLPPEDLIQPITDQPSKRRLSDTDPRILQQYRASDQQTMNMTLKVLSVAPRVFQIDNFLSEVEVQHIVKLASGITLKKSLTGDEKGEPRVDNNIKTRTSYNSWVSRQESPIIDAIYRRAADLLRIDEALLRDRADDEFPDLHDKNTIAEDLQLVHYDVMQGESAP
jgi:prolyl 4-hydroxylase